MSLIELVAQCEGFDWDEGNADKNWLGHGVAYSECEQIFFNTPLLLNDDFSHGDDEDRFLALGRTDVNRKLFLFFTVRAKRIRVISARDMSKKERHIYESKK